MLQRALPGGNLVTLGVTDHGSSPCGCPSVVLKLKNRCGAELLERNRTIELTGRRFLGGKFDHCSCGTARSRPTSSNTPSHTLAETWQYLDTVRPVACLVRPSDLVGNHGLQLNRHRQ